MQAWAILSEPPRGTGREKGVTFTEHPVDSRHWEKAAGSIFTGRWAEAEVPLDTRWERGVNAGEAGTGPTPPGTAMHSQPPGNGGYSLSPLSLWPY